MVRSMGNSYRAQPSGNATPRTEFASVELKIQVDTLKTKLSEINQMLEIEIQNNQRLQAELSLARNSSTEKKSTLDVSIQENQENMLQTTTQTFVTLRQKLAELAEIGDQIQPETPRVAETPNPPPQINKFNTFLRKKSSNMSISPIPSPKQLSPIRSNIAQSKEILQQGLVEIPKKLNELNLREITQQKQEIELQKREIELLKLQMAHNEAILAVLPAAETPKPITKTPDLRKTSLISRNMLQNQQNPPAVRRTASTTTRNTPPAIRRVASNTLTRPTFTSKNRGVNQ